MQGLLKQDYAAEKSAAMRRLICMRSSSLSSGQLVTSSNVRKQLRQTSSPKAVVQCPIHGHSAVISLDFVAVCMSGL